MSLKDNIELVLKDIKKYSEKSGDVKLVVASKYVDAKGVQDVFEAGGRYFGENRVQAFVEKFEKIDNPDYKWHFIGHLQKNKVKYIIDKVEMIHSVDSLSLAKEINKRAKSINRVVEILIEVNISKEESKHGFLEEELLDNFKEFLALENIRVKGLMTMAPFTEDEAVIRAVFRGAKNLKDDINKKESFNMSELSMGMSNDYKIALEEGSTLIRVGSSIFK